MRLLSHVHYLFLASVFVADPPVPIPPAATLDLGAPIVVPAGKKIILVAETSAKKVTWVVPSGCDSLPLDGKRLAVWANPGTYTFAAMVPSGDDVIAKQIILTVTGPQPPPPPLDPLITSAQAAYTADTGPAKALDKKEMQAVYSALIPAMDDPNIKTAKNLFDVNKGAMDARIDGRIAGVRKVFSTDFGLIFPPNTPESHVLTQTERDAAKTRFKTYIAVLEEVK